MLSKSFKDVFQISLHNITKTPSYLIRGVSFICYKDEYVRTARLCPIYRSFIALSDECQLL